MAPVSDSSTSGKKNSKRKIEEIRSHLVEDEDASSEEDAPKVAKKPKKPKHLNRKIAQAQQQGDNSILETLTKQKEELAETKTQRAVDWENLCKKLCGDKWNQDKFDKLMTIGLNKKKMLEALGVEREREKKKKDSRATTKAPKPNRKTVSRNKKKQKKMAASGGKPASEAPSK
jgi:hypothetical protein